MFSLTIVEGRQRGQRMDLQEYPFVVGSNADAHLRLSEPGVWDNHLVVELNDSKGPALRKLGDGTVSLNSDPVEVSALRNGDLISIGAVVLRFGLSPVKRKPLAFHNSASWAAIIAIVILELVLMLVLKTP